MVERPLISINHFLLVAVVRWSGGLAAIVRKTRGDTMPAAVKTYKSFGIMNSQRQRLDLEFGIKVSANLKLKLL